jgi:hypothetical protein
MKSDESVGALVEKLEQRGANEIVSKCAMVDGMEPEHKVMVVDVIAGDAGRKLLQTKLDLAIVHLICAAALPPTVVNYVQWKNIFRIANTRYNSPSSTKFADDLIPGEAARVCKTILDFLRTQTNLTISYDGATIKKPQSVHFTTPDGHSFLVEGQEASDESHSGQHICELLL